MWGKKKEVNKRCRDCGNLWVQLNDPPFRTMATPRYRQLGEFSEKHSTGCPICNDGIPIEGTFLDYTEDQGMKPVDAIVEIMAERRADCSWEKWTIGLDPKEQDMQNSKELNESMAWRSFYTNLAIAIATFATILAMIFMPVIQRWFGIK